MKPFIYLTFLLPLCGREHLSDALSEAGLALGKKANESSDARHFVPLRGTGKGEGTGFGVASRSKGSQEWHK